MSRDLRIGIDVQTLETNERSRGIGRLCERTIRILAENCPGVELRLFGLGATPSESILPLLTESVKYAPIRLAGDQREHLRQGCAAQFLWSTPEAAELDLYHVTSPLMFDILLPVSGPCPIVTTLLDAIPAVMQFRGTPMFDSAAYRRYLVRVNVIRSYQGFLPISQSAANDCTRYLDLSPHKMTVTYVPIEQQAGAVLSVKSDHSSLARYKLHPGYVVTVTGYNERKNISGTLRSYAMLPEGLRIKHPLVVICSLTPEEDRTIRSEGEALGISSQIILSGYVSDEDLVALVRNASVMLFASLYEGFGIPVAEAMACGTPVIVADNSSLGEVIGDSGMLLNSADEAAFATALEKLLINPVLREDLSAQGFMQVGQFAPERYLDRLLAGYGSAMRSSQRPESIVIGNHNLPRIALFSPLPPQSSGIAEYTAQLVRQLEGKVVADCYVEVTASSKAATPDGLRRFDACSFHARNAANPYDAIIYQIGNNKLHAYALPYAERYPGIVVFHDFNLLGLYQWMARENGQRAEAAESFSDQYPDADSSVWESDEKLGKLDLGQFSMTRTISNGSLAIVVHSEWLKNRLCESGGNAGKVNLIPLGVDLAAADAPRPDRAELRKRFLLPADAFVIVSVGVINRFKRVREVLDTFAEFNRTTPNVFFVLAGPAEPAVVKQMVAFCAARNIRQCVRFLGYCECAQMLDAIAMADVCVNLRFPTMGESSATLMNIMAMGKPALVTPVGQFLELPDDVCWKVRIESEASDLLEYLRFLRAHPEAGEIVGNRACEFVQGQSWAVAAKKYRDVISAVIKNRSN